jgi:hypothetical protein
MYLVADKGAGAQGKPAASAIADTNAWHDFPYSSLSHHGSACCDVARHWILAMDLAQLGGADRTSGPRWLRQRSKWGPSSWPMHWCEAAGRDVVDCGAHAALAHEAFVNRGLTAFRAQFVQRYDPAATEQWRTRWTADKVSDHWIRDDVIYHEGNALLVSDDEVKLWDASAGWWIDPRQAGGYGSLVMVRIWTDGRGGDLKWGDRRIAADAWAAI